MSRVCLGILLLVVVPPIVGDTLDSVLADEYSDEFMAASTETVNVLSGETTSIVFTLRGHLHGPFYVHLLSNHQHVTLGHRRIRFSKGRPVKTVNLTGLEPTGRTTVKIDRCSPTPCPFKSSNVFATITVYRSRVLSVLVVGMGWIYFVAWSISFYPQIILNFRRKSVEGLNCDFVILSTIGFAAYSIYSVMMYTSREVQEIYLAANAGSQLPVMMTDVLFALHALVACTILLVQSLIYSRGGLRVTYFWSATSLCLSLVCVVSLIASLFNLLNWLQFINAMSIVKLIVSLVKYLPQLILNVRRRSTKGWSLGYAILDFTGAALVVMQLLLQAINTNDYSIFGGNPVKISLATKSLIFDCIFIWQHFSYGANGAVHNQPRLGKTIVTVK